MPLSDHEQRLLEQIERALIAEDPKFASTVASSNLRSHTRRRIRRAAVGFVLGFALLLGGLVATLIPVSVGGFVVMLVSVLYGMAGPRHPKPEARGRSGGPTGKNRPSPAQGGPGVVNKFEERWKKRRGDDDRPF